MTDKPIPVPAALAKSAWINRKQYQQMYKESLTDPEGFWAKEAAAFPGARAGAK